MLLILFTYPCKNINFYSVQKDSYIGLGHMYEHICMHVPAVEYVGLFQLRWIYTVKFLKTQILSEDWDTGPYLNHKCLLNNNCLDNIWLTIKSGTWCEKSHQRLRLGAQSSVASTYSSFLVLWHLKETRILEQKTEGKNSTAVFSKSCLFVPGYKEENSSF